MLTPRLKHMLHPLRTMRVARRMVAARLDMRTIAARADTLFADDPRYKLSSVTEGFASRPGEEAEDAALLERICAAYIAAEAGRSEAPWYAPTGWWMEVRRRSLAPVMEALRTRDIAALRRMYANFFRDPCSGGLIGVPYGMTKAYFGQAMTDRHRRVYLYDVLHRLAYWVSATGGQVPISALRGPSIGNPFGAVIYGTLIATQAEFRHSCAHRVGGLLPAEDARVFEIGGGFGGMAYYLLRDFPKVRYVNFDLPESIALASYYLMKAFPERTFALYGEPCVEADVRLMPLWAMDDAQANAGDVTFSSHAMSDLTPVAVTHYLETIERMTKHHFLAIGADRPEQSLGAHIEEEHPCFALSERRVTGWNAHRSETVSEVELLYRVGESSKCNGGGQGELAHASR